MKPEETVDYNIKVAWHAISRMYNTQAAQNDITTSIGFVLLNIDQERGTPATKIAPCWASKPAASPASCAAWRKRALFISRLIPWTNARCAFS